MRSAAWGGAVCALFALLVGSCTRSASTFAPSAPATRSSVSPLDGAATSPKAGETIAQSPEVTDLTEIALTADLSDRADDWTIVASIPFGDRTEELGFIDDPGVSSHPVLPAAFAFDADGSIWILDPLKQRVAHYSVEGRYLGELTGLRFDGDLPVPNDIGSVDGRVFVLHQLGTESSMAELRGDGGPGVTPLTDGGDTLTVPFLMSSTELLLGRVAAFPSSGDRPEPEPPGWGPSGVATFDPARPDIPSYLPGVPVGSESWARSRPVEPQGLEVAYLTASSIVIQPLRVEVRPGPAQDSIPGLVGPRLNIALGQAVGLEVQVAPSRLGDRDAGSGTWFLQIGPGGAPLAWTRIPGTDVRDELQTRRIAADPSGIVFAMVAQGGAMRIYRLG